MIDSKKRNLLTFSCLVGFSMGCNLIVGIEKGSFDPTIDQPQGSGGSSGGGGDRLPDWGPGLRFASDTCSQDIDADEALIVGCMLRASCDPLIPAFSTSDCVTYGLQSLSGPESCGQRAESCSDIEDCINRGYLTADEETEHCSAGDLWVCDGDDAIHCTDYPYRHECKNLGAECVPHSNEDYSFVWGCSPSPEPDCEDKDEGLYFCRGDDLYTCVDGVAHGKNCASSNSTCVEDVEGDAYCNDRLTTCDDVGTLVCDDDAMKICDVSGRFVTYDCAAIGLSCNAIGTSEGFCEASGCDRDFDCSEGCFDEETMRICIGGASVLLDCGEYGFSGGCVEGSLFDGTDFAICI